MYSLIILILFVVSLIDVSLGQLNGRCGYPGKPYRAKLEPDNKLHYEEGEEVTYQCSDFWAYVQTRRCEKGKWTGSQPRCGDFVTGIKMKDSRVEDISDPGEPQLIFEHKNMTIIDKPWKYPTVFTSNRFPKARLRVVDKKKHRWSFNFTAPAVKLFLRIGFNFINFTLLPQEVKDNFVFNISVRVSPHRKCQLIHQSKDIWRQNGVKFDSEFICDSLSSEDFKMDVANPGDYMFMETQSSLDIVHELIALFFGKSYGTEEEPLCGEPEHSISERSRFNVPFKDYIIDCKPEKYTPSKNGIIERHGMKCSPDMKWKGSHPECVPTRPCSLENLSIGSVANQTVVTSLDGLYFFNQSLYYAIDGTGVNFGCKNPSTDIMVGKGRSVCQKDGLWNGTERNCFNPRESLGPTEDGNTENLEPGTTQRPAPKTLKLAFYGVIQILN